MNDVLEGGAFDERGGAGARGATARAVGRLMRLRFSTTGVILVALCVLLTLQMNRLLQQNRTLKVENDKLYTQVIRQQEVAIAHMQRRLDLIHRVQGIDGVSDVARSLAWDD